MVQVWVRPHQSHHLYTLHILTSSYRAQSEAAAGAKNPALGAASAASAAAAAAAVAASASPESASARVKVRIKLRSQKWPEMC